MRSNQDTRKVDIDTYFSDVTDHVETVNRNTHPRIRPDSQTLDFFKQLLVTPPNSEEQVLKPYQNERSMLTETRDFSTFELELAYGAVCKLKNGLQEDAPEDSPPSDVSDLSEIKIEVSETKTVAKPKTRWFRRSLRIAAALTVMAIAADISRPYVVTCLAEKCYSSLQNGLTNVAQDVSQQVSTSRPEPLEKEVDSPDKKYFSEGLNYAYAASKLTQHAHTSEDWQQIVYLWQLALNNLEYIPSMSDLYSKAQAKDALYRRNLAYSRQELEMAPFREGVKAAEEASKLAKEADTREEWQTVANQWKSALTMMQAVPSGSEQYPVAESKLVEYSTKFAYTQKRYLDSQIRHQP